MPAAQQAGTARQAQQRKQEASREPLTVAEREPPVQFRVQVWAWCDLEIRAGIVRHPQMIDGGRHSHHHAAYAA